jgi:hypothetical protein
MTSNRKSKPDVLDISYLLSIKHMQKQPVYALATHSKKTIKSVPFKKKLSKFISKTNKSNNYAISRAHVLTGGKILGEGGNNRIMSDPRLPSVNENIGSVFINLKNWLKKASSEVSKLSLYKEMTSYEIMQPYELIKSTIIGKKNITELLKKVNNYFALPTEFNEFVLKSKPIFVEFDIEFITSPAGRKIYNEDYFKLGDVNKYNLIVGSRIQTDHHIIFDKAVGDLNTYYLNIKNVVTLNNYFTELNDSVLKGIKYLHYNGLAHFDLKPDNILVFASGNSVQFKISDFDLLSDIQERITNPEQYISKHILNHFYLYYPAIMYIFSYTNKNNIHDTTVNTTGLEPATVSAHLNVMAKNLNSSDREKENINVYYSLSNKINMLCEANHLNSEHVTRMIRNMADMKFGTLSDEDYKYGIISGDNYYLGIIDAQFKMLYRKYNNDGHIIKESYYTFVAQFVDVYSFCVILFKLVGKFIDELISMQIPLTNFDLRIIDKIISFIEKYQTIETYEDLNDNTMYKPIDVLIFAYKLLLSDITGELIANRHTRSTHK